MMRRLGYPCRPPPAYDGHCWECNRLGHHAGDPRCFVMRVREDMLANATQGGHVINITGDRNGNLGAPGATVVATPGSITVAGPGSNIVAAPGATVVDAPIPAGPAPDPRAPALPAPAAHGVGRFHPYGGNRGAGRRRGGGRGRGGLGPAPLPRRRAGVVAGAPPVQEGNAAAPVEGNEEDNENVEH